MHSWQEVTMKYYMVTAKCGHVGRCFYYKGNFFLRAESAKDAARQVRYFPRVKHDHKDAILSVLEVDYLNYLVGKEFEDLNPYYKCSSKQEQSIYWEEISRNVYEDSHSKILKLSKREHHLHSLRKVYNNDPSFEEFKNYRGVI